jgi:two-component system sensor histidine kinase SenX3
MALARTVNAMRRDIAERIYALERERSARDAILSTLEEGVALFDADGSVLYQNQRSRRLIGPVTRLEQVAPGSLQQAVVEAEASGIPQRREVRVGIQPRTIDATAVPVPHDGRVLFVTQDVSEARAVDAVRRDFVANASHELKTPVASLQALAETIATASRDDPDAIPRFAVQLEGEAMRLGRVISDLLDLSRLEGEPGEPQDVRLDLLVREEAEGQGQRAREAGVDLSVLAAGPAVVRGSKRDLALLVRNLVENAVQYTRPGGSVEVAVTSSADEAEVVVRDTGIGIPSRDRTRVFERFYRVDRARSRQTGGTGLGLSIVRHVAENHGGTVEVDSALGSGSTFTVRLPLIRTGGTSPRPNAPDATAPADASEAREAAGR